MNNYIYASNRIWKKKIKIKNKTPNQKHRIQFVNH